MTEKEMVEALFKLRERIDDLEQQRINQEKIYNDIIKELHEYMMLNGLDKTGEYSGIGKIHFDGLRTFATVKKEEEQQLFDWLTNAGMGDIIKPTVHYNTLSSIISQQIEDGLPVPKFVNVYQKPKMKLIKQRS